MEKRPDRVIIISSVVIFVMLSIGVIAYMFYNGRLSNYSQPYKREEFKTFETELKKSYSYVDDVRFNIIRPGDIDVNVIINTKELPEWDEVTDLFRNGIAVFLRSDTMMNIIKEDCGNDPLKARFPSFYVEIRTSPGGSYRVQFESSYYNTYFTTNLTAENIVGYNSWGAWGPIVPRGTAGFKFD